MPLLKSDQQLPLPARIRLLSTFTQQEIHLQMDDDEREEPESISASNPTRSVQERVSFIYQAAERRSISVGNVEKKKRKLDQIHIRLVK